METRMENTNDSYNIPTSYCVLSALQKLYSQLYHNKLFVNKLFEADEQYEVSRTSKYCTKVTGFVEDCIHFKILKTSVFIQINSDHISNCYLPYQ